MDGALSNRVVGGRYRILEVRGAGGFGTVCKAEHVKLGRLFAIKFLHREFHADRRIVRRFEREARAVCRIGHSNIVDVYDYGEDPELGYYFVMEYLEGESLGSLLKREGALRFERAAPILLELVSAIEAAHRCGLVHRDIKPENVFLVRSPAGAEVVKLLDFGLVTALEDESVEGATRTGTVLGTPQYMAPEQATGEGVDGRSDLYSLGVLMYRMFAGRVPFHGTSALAILSKHQVEQPVPPRQAAPERRIPPALERLILECMAKRPADRIQSATDVFARLREIAEDEEVNTTVHLHPVKAWLVMSPITGAGRRVLRWAIAAAVAASGVAIVALAAWVWLAPDGREPPPAAGAVPGVAAGLVADAPPPEEGAPRSPPDPVPVRPPEPAPRCRLDVGSRPEGAAVYLSGEATPRGTTPFAIDLDCAALPGSIRLRKASFLEERTDVPVVLLRERLAARVDVTLRRAKTDERKCDPVWGCDPKRGRDR
jgi:serine/threonine-protein kinase